MIKYLGSKRVLVPVLGDLVDRRRRPDGAGPVHRDHPGGAGDVPAGLAHVTAVDTATYSEVLARCYVELDAATVDTAEVAEALDHLASLPPVRGYVTETFCERARFFHPRNGVRIDAVRQGIDDHYGDHPLRAVLLTSLLEAADAVDSTVGVQMAYLKQWAPRALAAAAAGAGADPGDRHGGAGRRDRGAGQPAARRPRVPGPAVQPAPLLHELPRLGDARRAGTPRATYGVACKRLDSRDAGTRSPFNRKREMPAALAQTVKAVDADVVVVSLSDEGFVPVEELVRMGEARGESVRVLAFDSRRYVGARIGVYNPRGEGSGRSPTPATPSTSCCAARRTCWRPWLRRSSRPDHQREPGPTSSARRP